MRKYHSHSHSIDLLFTISLFFVFTITSLYVTTTGASVYESTVEETSKNYSVFTSISYLEQKLQRYDTANGISIIQEDGTEILCLHETISFENYTTYIYTRNGKLMELFIKDGTTPSFENGTPLMDSCTLSLKKTTPNLLTLTLTDETGSSQSLTIYLKSKGGMES